MIRYLFAGIRSFLCLSVILISSSCTKNVPSSRGKALCDRLDSVFRFCDLRSPGTRQVDSLLELADELPRAERYAVVCKAYTCSRSVHDTPSVARCLRLLKAEAFPEVNDKFTGFLLLDPFAASPGLRDVPSAVNPEAIASLLFEMETRFRLTDEERCWLQIVKSEVYYNYFREYRSAALVAHCALELAKQGDVDKAVLERIYRAFMQSCIRLDLEDVKSLPVRDFLDYADRYSFDSGFNRITSSLGLLYWRENDPAKALYWLDKSDQEGAFGLRVPLYLALDSIQAALAYIEKKRAKGGHEVLLGGLAWEEACVYLKIGDSARYERCVKESVRVFDRFRAFQEVEGCAPSEAYARLLWAKGDRDEAIRRMEQVTRNLQYSLIDYGNSPVVLFDALRKRLERLRLLIDYYREAGRPDAALRQSLLCDSLQREFSKAQLRSEKEKSAARMYVGELTRNLDLQAAHLMREQYRVYVICSLLAVSLLAIVVLAVLYKRRKKQLTVLYRKQKEVERLQQEKWQVVSERKVPMSADEELFYRLEKIVREEQLFRNPGFSLADLCRLGCSNRMYVSSCINKYAGMNLNQWINKARINYALELIRSGEDDLMVISENSGFSSAKSFFRSFKQFTDLTPRQYIVRERRGESE